METKTTEKEMAKATKTAIKIFTVAQYRAEEEYLRTMHRQGWKFVDITGVCAYHFEACEPEDVIYRLDYNKEGSAHMNQYVQMFADCGWDYVLNFSGYSYFRKPASQNDDDEDIFCDDESRLEMMDRVFGGKMVPLLVIFSILLIPSFVNCVSHGMIAIAILTGVMMALYIAIFLKYAADYYKFKKHVKR